MSGFGARFRTDTAAVWPIVTGSTSGYGDDYGDPYLVAVCQFSDDKVKRDRNGVEFVPLNAFESGELIEFGSLIRTVPNGTDVLTLIQDGTEQTVRAIKQGTELRGSKDYVIYTG
jgi:hypothetical protein